MKRFWEKVKVGMPGECWEWQASTLTTRHPYGRFWLLGKNRLAHRVAYELEVGEVEDGKCVLHKCDSPRCVNPVHLFVGTQMENVVDMVVKGRCPLSNVESGILERVA